MRTFEGNKRGRKVWVKESGRGERERGNNRREEKMENKRTGRTQLHRKEEAESGRKLEGK